MLNSDPCSALCSGIYKFVAAGGDMKDGGKIPLSEKMVAEYQAGSERPWCMAQS